MHWHIHIGTEKTGSSHLQCLLALSRPELRRQGFSFPSGWAHDERCMRRGQISAGNARLLAEAVQADEIGKARRLLARVKRYAQRLNAPRIILSSEWLLSALARPARLKRFLGLLDEQGSTSVSIFLVLRDPLEQCLSLYKHRAKGGTAGDISYWLTRGYDLPQQLRRFREHLGEERVHLTVRRYSRESGALDRLFFEDWLGISIPQKTLPAPVNPSLTLSELTVIRQVAESRPEVVQPLYERLAAIADDEKAQGHALEAYARVIAARTVAACSEEWEAWNERLPDDEQLTVPTVQTSSPHPPEDLSLSVPQFQAIAEVLSKAATSQFMTNVVWRTRLRPALGRIKRALWH